MLTLLLLAAAPAAVWAWLRHGPAIRRALDRWAPPADNAGASADARARQLRTPLVRLADAFGIPTRAGTEAARWRAGAAGERRTAARLAPLTAEGWTLRYDLALPNSRANVDALAISPAGAVIMPDTKRWTAHWNVTVRGGRLLHGGRDVTDRLAGVLHEASTVSGILGIAVTPLVVLDGPPLVGAHGRPVPELRVQGIRIVPADRLVDVLRAAGRIPSQRSAADLTRDVDRALRPYTSR